MIKNAKNLTVSSRPVSVSTAKKNKTLTDLEDAVRLKKTGLRNFKSFVNLFSFMTLLAIFSTGCEPPSPYQQGELLYTNFCSNCHMTDGEGLANLIPPMNHGAYLRGNHAKIACSIRNGVKGEIMIAGRKFDNEMEPVYPLNDVEITNVINYMLYMWGETDEYVSHKEIKGILDSCSIIDHSRNF